MAAQCHIPAPSLTPVTAGEPQINGGSVANSGTMLATTGGTLDLESVTVTNTASGLVQVNASSFLDLEAATISGGDLTNSGTVTSTGASFLTSVTTTNNAGDLIQV